MIREYDGARRRAVVSATADAFDTMREKTRETTIRTSLAHLPSEAARPASTRRDAIRRLLRGFGFLCGLALAVSCGPADGASRDFQRKWPNGHVRAQGREVYSDGEWRKEGPVTFFYDDDRKQAEGSYLAGLESGHWRHWLADGTRAEGSYEAGQRVGPWTYWHENGKKQESGQYEHGMRVGRWTWWYPSGVRHEVNEYLDNQMHGYRIAFDEDGQVNREACGQFERGVRTGPLPPQVVIEAWLGD